MNQNLNFIKSNAVFFFLCKPLLHLLISLTCHSASVILICPCNLQDALNYFIFSINFIFITPWLCKESPEGCCKELIFLSIAFLSLQNFMFHLQIKYGFSNLFFTYIFIITHSYAIINLNKMCESYYLIVDVRKA